MITGKDKDGRDFAGNKNYRLHVLANVPVTQYWSMTVYNRDTHTFIHNVNRVGRSSQSPGLKVNDNGSVDLYVGPKPPASGEPNWVPTDPKGPWTA